MRDTSKSKFRCGTLVVVVVVVALLGFLALLAMRLITGRSLGLWNLVVPRVQYVSSLGRALIDSRSVSRSSRGDLTNVVFLHHSTGGNLIAQGGVRERFTDAGYDFWDHGYNHEGLRRPDGTQTGYSYSVPGDV